MNNAINQLLASTELWAAIIGAVFGSFSAGIITLFLQLYVDQRDRKARNREKKDRLKTQLLALSFELTRAASDLRKLFESIISYRKLRSEYPADNPMWTTIKPLAWLPPELSVSSDQLLALAEINRFDLINRVQNVVATHQSAINVWHLYGQKRHEIGEIFETREEAPGRQVSALTNEQRAKHLPKLIVLEDLARAIDEGAEGDYFYAAKVLEDFLKAANSNTDLNLSVEHKFEGAPEPGA